MKISLYLKLKYLYFFEIFKGIYNNEVISRLKCIIYIKRLIHFVVHASFSGFTHLGNVFFMYKLSEQLKYTAH